MGWAQKVDLGWNFCRPAHTPTPKLIKLVTSHGNLEAMKWTLRKPLELNLVFLDYAQNMHSRVLDNS